MSAKRNPAKVILKKSTTPVPSLYQYNLNNKNKNNNNKSSTSSSFFQLFIQKKINDFQNNIKHNNNEVENVEENTKKRRISNNFLFNSNQKYQEQQLPTKYVHYANENYWDAMRYKEYKIDPIKVPLSQYKRMTAIIDNDNNLSSSQFLSLNKQPPRGVKMLTRDYIHDSLYNPHYGYFSKEASIFTAKDPIPFNSFKDNYEFMDYISELYKKIDSPSSSSSSNHNTDTLPDNESNDNDNTIPVNTPVTDVSRQVWHTPSELFKPWYGYSIADYIINQITSSPKFKTQDVPLKIYEIGAGNGTIMKNILDFFQFHYPDIYKTMQYHIIEISTQFSNIQQQSSSLTFGPEKDNQMIRKHKDKIKIINKSILDWDFKDDDPCFVIAMEVIDNLSHDVIRYDFAQNTPFQGIVLIDETGDYREAYEPVTDPKLLKALECIDKSGHHIEIKKGLLGRKILSSVFPFTPSFTKPQFIPTNCFELLDILFKFFPKHHLILSDFSELGHSVQGISAPVVQTRYKGAMVPCSTYLVQPGWFDIFFPTNFQLLKSVYDYKRNVIHQSHTSINSSNADSNTTNHNLSPSKIYTQREFLLKFSKYVPETTTKSGDNPMISFYENMSFFTSH